MESPAAVRVRGRAHTIRRPRRTWGDRALRVGFLSDDGSQTFARPVGLAVAADGALLIADEANGVIYRVSTTRATQRAALGR